MDAYADIKKVLYNVTKYEKTLKPLVVYIYIYNMYDFVVN